MTVVVIWELVARLRSVKQYYVRLLVSKLAQS